MTGLKSQNKIFDKYVNKQKNESQFNWISRKNKCNLQGPELFRFNSLNFYFY